MDRKGGSRRTEQDDSMIDQVMMLRFRPIAPKPPESDPDAGGSQFSNKGLLFSGIRTKRKYVRVRRTRKNRTSKKVSSEEKKMVTLQLLPEKDEEEDSPKQHDNGERNQWPSPCPNPSSPTNIRDCIDCCIILETLTTCSTIDAMGLGQIDMNRVAGFGVGFVTDLSGRIVWVNEGYKAMVLRQLMAVNGGSRSERWPEMVVRLIFRQGVVMPYLSGSFTSLVKIESTWRKERWTQTVPCDVWRMEIGGFAWRLDVDASLRLGIDR